jgi:hypothetical protein
MPYQPPQGRFPGDLPPPQAASISHLRSLPSAYEMAQNGLTNLSELALFDLSLGLGVDTQQGDHVRLAVSQGNSAEGVTLGSGIGLDVAGQGSGSIQFTDGFAFYGDVNFGSLNDVAYDPTAPQDIDNTIPENGVDKDPEKGQTTTTTSTGPDFEPVNTVSVGYPDGEPEQVQPTSQDNFQ